ncbi:hypothetical protein NE237_029781 [Protea cynaroides]|uniref:Acyl-coenzyme A thioesterase 13 n=1 Tax=Protea cynaroides TaxID=273540 RepID=A0A9Q0GST9_9MAGN|nr:hypothetical protein NE237_029781 [Protea cynaroides]
MGEKGESGGGGGLQGKGNGNGNGNGNGMNGKEEIFLDEANKWLQVLARKHFNQDNIQHMSLIGLQIVQVQRVSILFRLILRKELADRTGNCHVGAIAAIIDAAGATAVAAYTGDLKVSVDFNISYLSTVKIEEEVEIEAKMTAHRGKVSLTTVEFRRKKDGKVIALGKQWMSQVNAIPSLPVLQTRL